MKKKGNTLEKQGVERMVEMFRSQIDISFVKQFPLQRIMEIFEKGYVALEGEHIDLSHLKQRAINEYNEILKTRLKSEIGNLLNEIESIVLAGGGAYYIKNIRKDVYIPDTPEFSQARGYTKI
jgi:spore cortex formation protein SpoVR/YcgB (stage V sporulation)